MALDHAPWHLTGGRLNLPWLCATLRSGVLNYSLSSRTSLRNWRASSSWGIVPPHVPPWTFSCLLWIGPLHRQWIEHWHLGGLMVRLIASSNAVNSIFVHDSFSRRLYSNKYRLFWSLRDFTLLLEQLLYILFSWHFRDLRFQMQHFLFLLYLNLHLLQFERLLLFKTSRSSHQCCFLGGSPESSTGSRRSSRGVEGFFTGLAELSSGATKSPCVAADGSWTTSWANVGLAAWFL